jgi:hypothetical protein
MHSWLWVTAYAGTTAEAAAAVSVFMPIAATLLTWDLATAIPDRRMAKATEALPPVRELP